MIPGSNTKEGRVYHETAFRSEFPAQRSDSKHRLELLLKYQDFNRKNVLDVGCNVGYFSINLAMRGARVVGIDMDDEAVRIGQGQIDAYGIEDCVLMKADDERRYVRGKDITLALSVLPWLYQTEKNPSETIERLFAPDVAFVEMMYPGDGRAHIDGVANDEQAIEYLKHYYTAVFKIGDTHDETYGVVRNRPLFKCFRKEEHPVPVKAIYGSQAMVFVWDHIVGKQRRGGHEYDPQREHAALERVLPYNIAPAPIGFGNSELLTARIFGTPFSWDSDVGWMEYEFDRLFAGLQKAGVRHNDVRPSNLIVGNDGHMHLLDFGWAQITGNEPLPAGINPVYGGKNDSESFEKILKMMVKHLHKHQ